LRLASRSLQVSNQETCKLVNAFERALEESLYLHCGRMLASTCSTSQCSAQLLSMKFAPLAKFRLKVIKSYRIGPPKQVANSHKLFEIFKEE
jgi:hypothetical protein